MFEWFKSVKNAPSVKERRPPYSDERVITQIEKIKNEMKKNADVILQYKETLTDAGLLENNKRVEVGNLSPSEEEALEIYESLKEEQCGHQADLKAFENYLSARGVQLPSSNKSVASASCSK